MSNGKEKEDPALCELKKISKILTLTNASIIEKDDKDEQRRD